MVFSTDFWLIVLSLPIIIFIGFITSYEDIKKGLIRNKWILTLLAYSIIAFFILFAIDFFSLKLISLTYLRIMGLNIFISIIVAMLLWYINLWSAGDAKLFIAYSVAVPLTMYSNGFFPVFPSLILLINTFTPIFLFFTVKLFIKTSWKEKLESIKYSLNPKSLGFIAIYLFSLSWIIEIILKFLKIQLNLFIIALLLFLIMAALEYILHLSKIKIVAVISLLRFFLDSSIYTQKFLEFFILLAVSVILLRFFLLYLAYDFFTMAIYIEDLKEGMMVADSIVKEKSKYHLEKGLIIGIFHGLEMQKEKEIVFTEKLTKADVKEINRLHSSGKIKEHVIRIHETLPFATFMFMGVILTYLAQGNVLFLIRHIINLL